MKFKEILCLLALLVFVGCSDPAEKPADEPPKDEETTQTSSEAYPVFKVVWSEYPSWSALDVGALKGLVNAKEGGEYGPIEDKYKVDIVLQRRDYVQGGRDFSASLCDALCYTNIDSLNLAKGTNCTITRPTSTSAGADGVLTLDDLKNGVIYGPEDCVSEYLVQRAKDLGQLDESIQFTNMEPDAAAIALQNSGKGDKVQSGCLWQPFLLQTQETNKNAKLKFDSTIIPREIIDSIVWSNESLEKEGGKNAAIAVNELFDEVNKMLADPAQSDETTEAIGKKFSRLPADDMKEVLKKCVFYKTAEEAEQLFSDPEWQKLMTTTVVDTAVKIGVITEEEKSAITIGFNDPSKNLNFSTEYLRPDTSTSKKTTE